MNQEESLIKSSKVSLGMNSSKETSPIMETKPWVLLVCGDFGFTSKSPEKISSATIQDYIQTCGSEIRGNIEKNLPQAVQPFYIEYQIQSFKDFSNDQIILKTTAIAPFLDAYEIIENVSNKKITPNDGFKKLSALELPSTIKNSLLSLFQNETKVAPQNTKVDSILSMLDLGDESVAPPNPLIQAISAVDNNQGLSPAAISKNLEMLQGIIGQCAEAIKNSAAFTSIASPWYALRNLLKKIGRNRQIEVYIRSSRAEEATDNLQDSLSYCAVNDFSPDIILWNYDFTFSAASMTTLKELSSLTDTAKSLLIASLATNEESVKFISTTDSLRDLMQSAGMIAFNRFRKENASRTISLCAPSFTINDSKDTYTAGGGWLLLDQWVSSLISANAPFDFSRTSTAEIPDDRLLQYQISGHIANEASDNGLTIIRSRSGKILSEPTVVFDPGENKNFCSIGFNLLVNRTIRLTAEMIAALGGTHSIEDAAEILQQYLYVQLNPYHILSSDSALCVRAENSDTIIIIIDSENSIANNAIQFQFSLGYR